MPVTAADPGIFVVGPNSLGAVLHLDNTLVTAEKPAAAGEILQVFCTGLGEVSNPPPTGQPAVGDPLSQMPVFPSATVGGLASAVLFGGLAPNFVGLYQVNMIVAEGVQPGTHELIIIAPNAVASNAVLVAIQ
jgi:uncharacterized protein (TIGR03437 family)